MTDARSRGAAPRYTITPDRAGHAVAAGGFAIGATSLALLAFNGARGASSLVSAAMIATFFGVVAIVAVGGPIWLACHVLGRRGPGSAAGAGFGAALLLAAFAQALMPPSSADADAAWAAAVNAVASSLGIALIGAGVALLMWRIAYRREGPRELNRP